MRPANERRRYNVTSSPIGWTHTQIDPWLSHHNTVQYNMISHIFRARHIPLANSPGQVKLAVKQVHFVQVIFGITYNLHWKMLNFVPRYIIAKNIRQVKYTKHLRVLRQPVGTVPPLMPCYGYVFLSQLIIKMKSEALALMWCHPNGHMASLACNEFSVKSDLLLFLGI